MNVARREIDATISSLSSVRDRSLDKGASDADTVDVRPDGKSIELADGVRLLLGGDHSNDGLVESGDEHEVRLSRPESKSFVSHVGFQVKPVYE